MAKWAGKKITDGTEQSGRFPIALKDGYFKVDERSFEDLLALSADFASELPYYSLKNRKEGSWEELFTSDEAVIMAMIISTDIQKMKTDCLRLCDSSLKELVEYVYHCAKRINLWYEKLNFAQHKSAISLSQIISGVVKEKLAADLHGIGKIVEYLKKEKNGNGDFDFGSFDRIWGIEKDTTQAGGFLFSKSKLPELQNIKQLKRFLRSAFYEIINAISYLKTVTPGYLQDTLQSQTHDPTMGLFIAFLKLFQNAQQRINRFTQRHLDFYYYKYLKAAPRNPIPESAHIILQTEAGANEVLIPKGIEFTAGKDENLEEIVYLAENDLVVSDAKIQSLYTLHFQRDKLISPECELNYTSRVKADCLLTREPGEEDPRLNYWPLFGAYQLGAEKKEVVKNTAKDAEIGFAIASPVLLLKEGIRHITVIVELANPVDINAAVDVVLKRFEDSGYTLEDTLTEIFDQYLLNDQEFVNKENKNDTLMQARDLVKNISPNLSDFHQQMQDLKQQPRHQQDLVYRLFLTETIKQADSEQTFYKAFGRFFSQYLLTGQEWLSDENKTEILAKAETCVDKSSLKQVKSFLKDDRHNIFYKLLKKPFTISLTAESGWYTITDYNIVPAAGKKADSRNGLKFELTLGPDVEAIVPYAADIHSGRWETEHPLIRFHIHPLANFYPYSLFYGLALSKVIIETGVKDAKELKAYNQYGRLDPSKPFSPFGPLPTCNSYFVIGNYEVAKKNITDLKINLEWGELPRARGGFEAHYEGYETTYTNEIFKADVSVLQDGKWQPKCSSPHSKVTLFETQSIGGRVKQNTIANVDVLGYAKRIHPRIQEDEFDFQLKARNGFYRFVLSAPGAAFGHAAYPTMLTRILSENAKRKKPKSLPNPPYTPILNSISLDYRARTEINVAMDLTADDSPLQEKVFHIHPFGSESIFPRGREKRHYFLPQYTHDGNLFIGLSASQLSSMLTLFFYMADDSTKAPAYGKPEIVWFHLAANGWQRLKESCVISDTTQGFVSSGIVTLDIPSDIDRGNTIMPGDLFWLKVSTDKNLHAYSSLRAVQTQAMKVKRCESANATSNITISPFSASNWRPVVSIPGLGKVTPIGKPFDYRLKEDQTQLKTRVSERLRHKYRASTPWDYERLILEQFPEVFKVKCFPNVNTHNQRAQPGHVLIVVVPYLKHKKRGKCFGAKMNVSELNRIQCFIEKLTSSFVKVEVHNPVYEHIQIRCTVKFAGDIHSGLFIERLNQDISDYICPWHEVGYQAAFGWSIRREDIESYVRTLQYVDFVTNFSMLHITQDEENRFSLGDTARRNHVVMADESEGREAVSEADFNGSEQIQPKYPWSLAIPAKSHFIETMKTISPIKAEVTGIKELEVGNTFIISGNSNHAQEE